MSCLVGLGLWPLRLVCQSWVNVWLCCLVHSGCRGSCRWVGDWLVASYPFLISGSLGMDLCSWSSAGWTIRSGAAGPLGTSSPADVYHPVVCTPLANIVTLVALVYPVLLWWMLEVGRDVVVNVVGRLACLTNSPGATGPEGASRPAAV